MKNKEIERKEYTFTNGTLIKHFYKFPGEAAIHARYTVVKNGKESKSYIRIGDAMNFLSK